MTTLVFEALTSTTGSVSAPLPRVRFIAEEGSLDGTVASRLPALRAAARAVDIGSTDGAMPRLRLLAMPVSDGMVAGRMPRLAAFGSGGALAPNVALMQGTLPPLLGSSTGHTTSYGNMDAALPALRALALEPDGYSAAPLPQLLAKGWQVTPAQNFIGLVQSPGYLVINALGAVQRMLSITDTAVMDSTITPDFIHALLDLFTADDSYSQAAAVLQALADGASLADVAQMIIAADLLDSFVASAVQTDTAQITALLADGMLADDSADPLSLILAAISDGFYASLTIATGAEGWTAWVMTTQTKAMRRYTDWAFNSYAVRDEVFLGAGEGGIYRMGGDKDAGAAIRWAIRTGKLNFANGQMKSIPLAYIGVTSRGDILLRVRATTTRGVEVEQTYRMSPSTSTDARERRVKIGQGFRSVYWVFEIANDADGEAAEIHEWHALPVKHTGKLI